MGIGASIFLIAFGSILAFAVHADLGFFSINAAGWIIILAGVAYLVVLLAIWSRRRKVNQVTRRRVYRGDAEHPAVVEQQTYQEAAPPIPGDPGPPPPHKGGSL